VKEGHGTGDKKEEFEEPEGTLYSTQRRGKGGSKEEKGSWIEDSPEEEKRCLRQRGMKKGGESRFEANDKKLRVLEREVVPASEETINAQPKTRERRGSPYVRSTKKEKEGRAREGESEEGHEGREKTRGNLHQNREPCIKKS